MSKSTTEPRESQTESKDLYAIYSNGTERFFEEVEKTIPKYHQAITNFQRAYTTAWKNATESTISIQREFVTKSGTNTSVPLTIAKMVNDASEEMFKTHAVQTEAMLKSIEAAQQSINTFNDAVKTFAGLNRSAIQNWISACIPTRN